MNQNYAAAAYRSARTTVSPLAAVIALYDTVLVHVHNSAEAYAAGNYERQFNEIMRAVEILQALNIALDMQRGGSVAQSLRRFYETTAKALVSSSAKTSSLQCAERISGGIRAVRDAWMEIAYQ